MRRVLVVIAVAAAVAGLAGCRTDNRPEPPTPEPTAQEAALAFAQCMREHGVDLPDPGPDGRIRLDQSQVDQTLYQEALQACGGLLTAGEGADVAIPPAERQRLLDLAACIRDQGFPEFRDPEFSGGQVMLGGPGMDPTDPEFRAAMQLCERQAGLPAPGQDS
jgi:hypothetical protein